MMFNPTVQYWGLLAERLQLLLIDVSVKSAIIIMVAGILCLVLRRASAALRHLVWLLALVGMLCLPILSAFVPSRGVRAFTSPIGEGLKPMPVIAGGKPTPRINPPSSTPSPPQTVTAVGSPLPAVVTPKDVPSPTLATPPLHTRAPHGKQLAFMVGLVPLVVSTLWLLGVIGLLGRMAVGLLHLRMLKRDFLPVSEGPVAEIAIEILRNVHPIRPVNIFSASAQSGISMPLTWGFWQPVVVLPFVVGEWPSDRLRAALLHELAHVSRRDWIVQIMAAFTCALYWFNPLVWLAARALRQESERAADDYALTHGLRASDYANHLMEIALTIQDRRRPPRQTVAMVRQSKIEARLRAVLARGRRRQEVTERLRAVALAATVLLLIAVSTFRFSSRAVGNPSPPQTAAAQTDQNEVVAEPTDAPAKLSNGAMVSLIGIRDSQKKPDRWWKPDGTPLSRPIPASLLTFPRVTEGGKGRVFAVAASYDLAAQPKSTWVSPPKYVGRYYARAADNPSVYYAEPNFTHLFEPGNHLTYVFGDQYQESTQGSRAVQIGITAITSRPQQKTATLICGVAAGPWTESVTCKKTPGKVYIQAPSGQIIFTLIPNPHHLTAAQAARGSAAFMVSDHFHATSLGVTANSLWAALNSGMNYDRTVLALDASGHVVTEIRGGTSSQPDGPTKSGNIQNELTRNYKTIMLDSIPNDQLRRVTSFRLLARPFQFIEFHDVPLQPQATTSNESAVTVARLSSVSTREADALVSPQTVGSVIEAHENQAVLQNGFKVSLVGLTQATQIGNVWNLYGGPWWSSDGTPITPQNTWQDGHSYYNVISSQAKEIRYFAPT